MQRRYRLTSFFVFAVLFALVGVLALWRPDATPRAQAAPTTALPLIDDFESGLPGTWFQYGDYQNGTFINTTVVTTNTVPGLDPNSVLKIEYSSAGWGAGTGNDLGGQDWSAYDGLAFWFKGAATGATFRVILSDNPDPNASGDTAERFAYEFVDTSAGWRHILIPWHAFFRDYAYQPPGAPNDGLTLTDVQAYALALPVGTSATVYVDDVRLVKIQGVDDFESGLPGTWFQYGDYQSGTFINTTVVTTNTVPGLDPNSVLKIEYNSAGWGAGTGNDLGGQDWSAYNGMGFWFWGSNSGQTYRVILSDNPDPSLPGDTAERFAYEFVDAFDGWRFISIPWDAFFRDYAYQPPGAPNDGLTLTDVQAYALALPGGTRTTYIDNVLLFGDGNVTPTVNFVQNAYSGSEGFPITLTLGLNTPPTTTVTVTVQSQDGTALAGVDYVPLSTTVTFGVGETEKTVVLTTLDDTKTEDDETLAVLLSNPQGVQLGVRSAVTVTIVDNDAPATGGAKFTLVDDFEQSALPSGQDSNGIGVGYVTWNAPGAAAAITLTQNPPSQVPGAVVSNTVLQLDVTIGAGQWAGYTHAFTNDAADTWVSQDWSSYEGICFWLYGNNTGGTLFFDILDNRNPGSTTDDAERWSYSIVDNFTGWKFFQVPFSDFARKEIGNGAPNDGLTLTEVWGYAVGGYGSVDMGTQTYYVDDVTLYGKVATAIPLQVAFADTSYTVTEGETAVVTVALSVTSTETVTVTYVTAESTARPYRDFVPVSGTLTFAPGQSVMTFTVPTLDNAKDDGSRALMLNLRDAINADLGFAARAMVTIEDDEPTDPALVDDFEGWYPFEISGTLTLTVTEVMSGSPEARPEQDTYERLLEVAYDTTNSPATLTRRFVEPQDWSEYEALSFWFYGTGSGETYTVELLDNPAVTTGDVAPSDWVLVWSDEFNDPAGTPPNPNVWTHEIGDGTMYGIPGWGNGEFQFYTDDPANASTDGQGNLVISLQPTDPNNAPLCWYGPCEYTSARLITAQKQAFKYGRIEARIKVPDGPAGLWPAFWMLGTNIGEVGWPQSGEIDIMEYVSRFPNEVFGTIHGPGYSGGAGFGNTYAFTTTVASDYHTFAVEWGPDEIHWYVDGINYHNATPADVAPNEWVFNHPFFLILNMAIGGNFGGDIDPSMTFPQELKVDYIRVYGAADTAERFEAHFVDDTPGWRRVVIPFSQFTRSATQPAGAPNDGLTLSAVSGYGLRMPQNSVGTFRMDWVYLQDWYVYYFPLIGNNGP
ncbi:MAG: glycosyl hydrolase family protein [Ardenticatenia bacterium]|nr:MAG: glycosyl hydrolase family protein [Ardenticatenia bacterium]